MKSINEKYKWVIQMKNTNELYSKYSYVVSCFLTILLWSKRIHLKSIKLHNICYEIRLFFAFFCQWNDINTMTTMAKEITWQPNDNAINSKLGLILINTEIKCHCEFMVRFSSFCNVIFWWTIYPKL